MQALRGVDAGATLRFTFTATLQGTDASSTSTSLELTALPSPVEAKLQGPRGDVLDTQPLVFSAESSQDPDDRAGRTPFRYQWSCTATDTATQVCYLLRLLLICSSTLPPCWTLNILPLV